MIPNFINKNLIPHKSGVYIFKNSKGDVIYVGKAIDLYSRVSSYFAKNLSNSKTMALVEHISDLETIIVESEIEALILEANLIKKYLPPYNIKLTDDKDYVYVKISKDRYPQVLTARKNELKDAVSYFGPFPSTKVIKDTLKKIRRVFPWCQNPPKDGKRASKPCFYYHLGLCPGPCAGKIEEKEYGKIIRRFIRFMEGREDDLLAELTSEMEDYSKKEEFEEASRVKKTILGINYLTQRINGAQVYLEDPNFLENKNLLSISNLKADLNLPTIPERIECYDISNLSGKMAVGSLVVLSHGEIDKRWYRRFKIHMSGKPNDFAMMAEMVSRRLNHPEWPTPDLMLIDGGRGQVRAAFEEVLKKNYLIPIFGLAKRREWLYTPFSEIIKLPKNSLSLRLVQKIRDEAHRFALGYHRKLRSRSFLGNGV